MLRAALRDQTLKAHAAGGTEEVRADLAAFGRIDGDAPRACERACAQDWPCQDGAAACADLRHRCDFLPPMRRLHASGISLNPIASISVRSAPRHAPKPAEMLIALARPRVRQYMKVASCCRPAHNRDRRQHQIHIARCKPVTNRARLRALALFGRRSVERAGL